MVQVLGITLGVVLGSVALLIAAGSVAILAAGRKKAHQDLLTGVIQAPGVGAETTLVITDIEVRCIAVSRRPAHLASACWAEAFWQHLRRRWSVAWRAG